MLDLRELEIGDLILGSYRSLEGRRDIGVLVDIRPRSDHLPGWIPWVVWAYEGYERARGDGSKELCKPLISNSNVANGDKLEYVEAEPSGVLAVKCPECGESFYPEDHYLCPECR